MYRLISTVLTLACLLFCPGVYGTPCPLINPPPLNCANVFNLKGGPPDTFLVSDVDITVGIASIRYGMSLPQPYDGLIELAWKDTNGKVFLQGGNVAGSTFYSAAWGVEWVGTLSPSTPSVTLLAGVADFKNSALVLLPCMGKQCPANYHDWTANVPPGGGTGGGGGGQPLLHALQVGASTLPPGFESVTETRATASAMTPSPTDPGNLDAATYDAFYNIVSRYEAAPGGYRYIYSVSNSTHSPISFDVAELGLSGSLAGLATATTEILSPNGPHFTRTSPTFVAADGSVVSGPFDALTPVPEPTSAALMVLGAGLLGLRLAAVRRPRFPTQPGADMGMERIPGASGVAASVGSTGK